MFGAGTSPMMEGTGSIVKAPQEARGRVWVEEILSVSPCAANGCEWRRKLPVRNRRTRSSGSMGRSWYLRRALVVPVFALIIRAWWAVTFPLHWVRTGTGLPQV